MKRSSILTLIAILLASACIREFDAFTPEEETLVGVSLPDAGEKTCLGTKVDGKYPTLWCEGDQVSLNGLLSQPLTGDKAGEKTALFHFKGSLIPPYNVLYPGTSSADEIVLPDNQAYTQGSFSYASMPMYASSESYENVSLSHLCALFDFRLRSNTPVEMKKILLTSLGGEPLCGRFKMKKNERGLFTGELEPIDVSSTVTLDISGINLGSQTSDFIVSIPAGEYSDGFLALVFSADGASEQLVFCSQEGNHIVAASKMMVFPEKEYSPSGETFLIHNAEDFLAYSFSASAYPQAVLLADIDMAGKEWTPIPDLKGNFNGAGHSVYGLCGPLATTISGTVKNLTVSADSSFPLFAERITGTINNCKAEGRVASTAEYTGAFANRISGEVVNCVCNADVEVSSPSGATIYAGGLAGCYSGTGKVSLCGSGKVIYNAVQNGGSAFIGGLAGSIVTDHPLLESMSGSIAVDVVYPSGVKTDRLSVGGIAGAILSPCSMKDCQYAGDISLSGAALRIDDSLSDRNDFGSIAGLVSTDGKVSFDGCKGTGSITLNGDGSAHVVAAGLVGEIDADEAELTDCNNSGDITLNGGDASNIYLGGILGLLWREKTMKVDITACVNSGKIAVYDGDHQSGYRITAGGILACAGSYSSEKKLILTVSDCVNRGPVDRGLGYSAVYKSGYSSFGGGIIGACGVCHMLSDSYTYSDIVVRNCSNEAQIRFNLFVSNSSFIEKVTSYSFSGGIVGLSRAAGGSVRIECCSNSGDILPNAGYAGGIVAFIHSSTVVTGKKISSGNINYTKNTGCVGEYAFETKNPSGSGYLVSGGIVGYLKNGDNNSRVEYCWNDGKIAGSTATKTRPFPGGIVGNDGLAGAVNCCKNSGYVRCYGSYTYQSGLITGTLAAKYVSNCGVGGHIWRDAWIEPTSNQSGDGKPYTNYIYGCHNIAGLESYPESEFYPGCTYWDGHSLLEWEK